jgi:hypothetical protein
MSDWTTQKRPFAQSEAASVTSLNKVLGLAVYAAWAYKVAEWK